MGALKQQFMLMQEQGISILDNPDLPIEPKTQEEIAINFLLIEATECITGCLELGLSPSILKSRLIDIIKKESAPVRKGDKT